MRRLLDMVVPIIEEDLDATLYILPYWEKYLPINQLIFIGSDKVQRELKRRSFDKIYFIDENTIIDKQRVCDIIADITNGDEAAVERSGWYLQQFLKMAYAQYCEDDYYLIWDADTAPLKRIDMFELDYPLFDIRIEEHMPFFNTIANLFGGMHKMIEGSFVAEHMVINCDIMNCLLAEIDNNSYLQGSSWYEKILRAIEKEELPWSGFSEFETYGTYCMARYPQKYRFREWHSCREGNLYFEAGNLTLKEEKWLAREFDALSFEKWQHRNSFAPFLEAAFSRVLCRIAN